MKDNKKPRKYFEGRAYNREYFNIIDSPDKAYVLGFLWGDGSYIPGKRTVALALATKDEPHLRRIAELIGLGASHIRRHMSRSFGYQEFSYSKIQMSHKTFFDSLEKLGYEKKQPRMMKIPNIPANLVRHFLRGLFDADGCVYCKTSSKAANLPKGRMEVSLPHLEAVGWWSKYFHENLGVQFSIGRDKSIYRVSIGNKSDLRKVYDFLYSDSDIQLERKHRKFRALIGRDDLPTAQTILDLAA